MTRNDIRGPDEDDEARVSVVLDLGQLELPTLQELLALRPAPPAASLHHHHQRAPRRLPPRRRPDKEVDGRELSDARRRRPQWHAGHHLHGCLCLALRWTFFREGESGPGEEISKWIIWWPGTEVVTGLWAREKPRMSKRDPCVFVALCSVFFN
jgi:hypothetical protein